MLPIGSQSRIFFNGYDQNFELINLKIWHNIIRWEDHLILLMQLSGCTKNKNSILLRYSDIVSSPLTIRTRFAIFCCEGSQKVISLSPFIVAIYASLLWNVEVWLAETQLKLQELKHYESGIHHQKVASLENLWFIGLYTTHKFQFPTKHLPSGLSIEEGTGLIFVQAVTGAVNLDEQIEKRKLLGQLPYLGHSEEQNGINCFVNSKSIPKHKFISWLLILDRYLPKSY